MHTVGGGSRRGKDEVEVEEQEEKKKKRGWINRKVEEERERRRDGETDVKGCEIKTSVKGHCSWLSVTDLPIIKVRGFTFSVKWIIGH